MLKQLSIGLASAALISACGMLQLDEDTEQAIRDQVAEWQYDPNGTDDHTLSASDSALGGASLLIPAGSLDAAADISLEEGASLVDADVAGEIGLSDSNTLSSAGAAVMFTSSISQDSSAPMTLQIPYEAGGGLAGTYLVVLFKVQKKSEDGAFFSGVIPTSELTTSDGMISLETRFFGAFQAAYATEEITERKEALSSTPPVAKNVPNDEPHFGVWMDSCQKAADGTGSEMDRFAFGRGSIALEMQHFASTDCSGKASSSTSAIGSFTLGKDSTSEKNAREVDITFKDMVMRPLSITFADDWNKKSMCGYKDWESGKGKSCKDEGIGPPIGETMLALGRIDGDTMYLNVGTPDQRPKSTTEESKDFHTVVLTRQK